MGNADDVVGEVVVPGSVAVYRTASVVDFRYRDDARSVLEVGQTGYVGASLSTSPRPALYVNKKPWQQLGHSPKVYINDRKELASATGRCPGNKHKTRIKGLWAR